MKKLLFSILLLFNLHLCAELNKETINQLAVKFGPLLIMHPEEESSPTSVPWFVSRCSLKFRKKDGSTELLIPKGKVTPDMIGNYTKDPKDFRPNGLDYFLDPENNKVTLKGEGYKNNISNAESYVNAVEKNNGDVVLQFMFFYAYQGAITIPGGIEYITSKLDIGIHQGDWEHIDVHLKKDGDNYKLDQIFYGRHQQVKGELRRVGEFKTVNDDLKEDRNGTHPVVYVAKNSHANYPKKIALNKDMDITSDKGPKWPTWKNNKIKYVGTFQKPEPGQRWILAIKDFRWGATSEQTKFGIEYHGNSPTTPTDSGWYRLPSIDKKRIAMYINKKRVQFIDVKSNGQKEQNSIRYSEFFDIEQPARMRNLYWDIDANNPQKEEILKNISFEVWQQETLPGAQQVSQMHKIARNISDKISKEARKLGLIKDKKIAGPISSKNPITKKLSESNNLYIANIKSNNPDIKDITNVKITIYGKEE